MGLLKKLLGRREGFPPKDLTSLDRVQLLSLMRHEAHRIEKAVYNDILEKKHEIYDGKRDRVEEIIRILRSRDSVEDEPSVEWAERIVAAYDNLGQDFIAAHKSEPMPYDPEAARRAVELMRSRRSCRVWAEDQPPESELRRIAHHMIDAARWAPTSGNRQPWRFRVMTDARDKQRLVGLKEEHCVGAPLLVFLGMDKSVYGFLGRDERSLYIDAGAAAMQMVLTAHMAGLGACWNHFADDLIASRPKNQATYSRFAAAMGIPERVAPVAIIAIGRAAFVPPVPARMNVEDLLLGDH